MQIYLIRHTTPDISKGVCYGQADIGLADTAQQEINAILNVLPDDFDCVYSSPLKRCTLLASRISTSDSMTDERLKEYNFGDWELTPWDDLKGDSADAWMHDFVNTCAPNGENLQEMNQRVISFFEELLLKDHTSCAVVTHAGVLRIVYAWILNIPLQKIFHLSFNYGTIVRLTIDKSSKATTIQHL